MYQLQMSLLPDPSCQRAFGIPGPTRLLGLQWRLPAPLRYLDTRGDGPLRAILANCELPRYVLDSILLESATAMAEFSEDFKRLILQSCLHYGMESFYQSWNCGYESSEGGLG